MTNHKAPMGISTLSVALGAGCLLLAAACGSSPPPEHANATSSIRAAQEVGASNTPDAALHLELAKEQAAKGKRLEQKGEHEKASLLFMQAQADGELAVALARSEAEKTEAQQAVNNLQTLRNQNP